MFFFLANYPLEVVQSLPKDLEPGVYYGWAQVDKGDTYKMVANIGWCPFYQNKQMSVVRLNFLTFLLNNIIIDILDIMACVN